jgi:hypothetical protein
MTAWNGQPPQDARAAASHFLGAGFVPLPWRRGVKGDDHQKGWQHQRPTPETLDRFFPEGADLNIGLLLGEPSGGLVDADLDSHEAVRAAPYLLPATDMISGRPGKQKSHYWYVTDDPPAKASAKFKDPDKGFYEADADDEDRKLVLVELRSTGGQTIIPPSAHPKAGLYAWDSFGRPARVAIDVLRKALCQVAGAALLARHWPKKGSRHDLALALAGGLLRGGMMADQAGRFLHATCVAAQKGGGEHKL